VTLLAADYSDGTAADWRPSEDEIERFERDGFLISPQILPDALLHGAWEAVLAFLSGRRDHPIAPVASVTDRMVGRGDDFDQLGYLTLQMDGVRALVTHPPIGRAAAMLLRAAGVRLFHDRTIVKPPRSGGGSVVGWHTDRAYWRGCSTANMLTAWVPFHDVGAEDGALLVVRGSHVWDNDALATAHRVDLDALEREVDTNGHPFEPVAMEMKRGQVSFHHCRAVHGSRPNMTFRPRAALAIHIQDAANRYSGAVHPNGNPITHTNDLICRLDSAGRPDYSDPDAFPPLWP
jgi:hypothetical protein